MPEEVIPPGKRKCFITGKLRKDTLEEKVRQDIARSLVEEYGYDKSDIDIEFPIKMGRAKKEVDKEKTEARNPKPRAKTETPEQRRNQPRRTDPPLWGV